MTTKIQKWGNSLAVRIPNEFAKNLNWSEGAVVNFQQLSDRVIITSSRPEYTLEQMIKGITKKNRHKLVWGDDKPRGKEIW
ncbi:MAG: AbrB/MazE/SpoVT family DNA-binding domain-containing protein [Candidatus Parcubacteria bacterium]|nr:AbrB/MazE/SpoVT family DNA-binding domain-containing protein [Candidatus Parcubacteria bacterium]